MFLKVSGSSKGIKFYDLTPLKEINAKREAEEKAPLKNSGRTNCINNLFYTLKEYEKNELYKALTIEQCRGIISNVIKTGKPWTCKKLDYKIELVANRD